MCTCAARKQKRKHDSCNTCCPPPFSRAGAIQADLRLNDMCLRIEFDGILWFVWCESTESSLYADRKILEVRRYQKIIFSWS